MIIDTSSNAYWRKCDMDLAKRAIRKAKTIMHHALLRGYGSDASRRAFLAQAMVEFVLEERAAEAFHGIKGDG